MKKDSNRLKALVFTPIALCALFAAGCETDIIESGLGITDNGGTGEVIALAIMETITLCVIPLALRLFKFGFVAKKVKGSRLNFMRFATVRILLLTLPLMANTALYYFYIVPAFGYMAIMLLLAMPFIYPSESRCKNEME